MKRPCNRVRSPAAIKRLLISFLAALLCCLHSRASLIVRINPVWGNDPVQPASLRYDTAAKENFSITRASYLVSEIALQRPDGLWLEMSNAVQWLDLEQSRDSFEVEAPAGGEFIAIRFSIGLTPAQNHADVSAIAAASPLNPNLDGLHWSWQGGYVFLAMEGLWRNSRGELDGWSYHLAGDSHLTRVTLPLAFRTTTATRMDVDFDIATLLRAPRPLSFGKDGSSTHSREGDPIAAALAANLPGSFRARGVRQLDAAQIAVIHPRPIDLPAHYTPYEFRISAAFPLPELPRDNPLISERVALGKKLFFDKMLSINGRQSCSSCHQAGHGNAEDKRVSVGAEGGRGTRNAMPLSNLAWKNSFFWDGRAASLREQSLQPIQNPVEMHESLTNLAARLEGDSGYAGDFAAAFGSGKITPQNISLALEQYLLTLVSYDSKFDRVMAGEETFTAREQRGFELFSNEYDPRRGQYGADCFHCHGGMLFQSQSFANNGLDSAFTDKGRGAITGKGSDDGKFAVPSLRNVEVTGPYMHDGRFRTLEEVVEHYSTGVRRSATLDPNIAKHPDGGVPLGAEDKSALAAFLRTLTDARNKPEKVATAAN